MLFKAFKVEGSSRGKARALIISANYLANRENLALELKTAKKHTDWLLMELLLIVKGLKVHLVNHKVHSHPCLMIQMMLNLHSTFAIIKYTQPS